MFKLTVIFTAIIAGLIYFGFSGTVHAQPNITTIPTDFKISPNTTLDPSQAQAVLSAPPNGNGRPAFDYPSLYPLYYNWAKTNLFNGTDYWTQQQPGGTNSQGINIRWLYSWADRNPPGKNLGGDQFVTDDGVDHSELDANGYPKSNSWIWSQCSGATMAEIFNAYKNPGDKQLRIAEVLQTESDLKFWDPYDGTTSAFGVNIMDGIKKTADTYGFIANDISNGATVSKLIDLAQNQKHPIMISAPKHWLVLWGADPNWQSDPSGAHIYLLDSSKNFYTWDPTYPASYFGSSLTRTKMSLDQFQGTGAFQKNGSYWTNTAILMTPKNSGATGLPNHGAFSVHSVADVQQAKALGIKYIIPYYWGTLGNINGTPFNPTDPSTPMGQELAKDNMKVIMDVTGYDPHAGTYKLYNSNCSVNMPFLQNVVNQVKNNSLTLGYWIKDDDLPNCNMKSAIQQVYSAIKKGSNGQSALDSNPGHYVIAGFQDAYYAQQNYADGETDIVALYPYRAYNYLDPVCGRNKDQNPADQDGIMDCEIQNMVKAINGKPWIGIYQAFWNDPAKPPYNNVSISFENDRDVQYDVQDFLKNGAISVVPFGWNATDVNGLASTDPNIRTEICNVTANLLHGTCQ